MIVTARIKLVNGQRLYEELANAGITLQRPSLLGTPFQQTGDEVRIEVADGQDEKTVLAVYAAHQPTPSEAPPDKYERLVAALEKRLPGLVNELETI